MDSSYHFNPNENSGNLSVAIALTDPGPIIQNTTVSLQFRRDFERYIHEIYKSPLTPRPGFPHPGLGSHSNTAPALPPTSESLQREFERYMRETAPPALSPPPRPTNYIVVPQEVFSFPTSILIPPIEFTPKGWRHQVFGLKINLPPRLSAKQDIERSLDMVFLPSQGLRELIITIQVCSSASVCSSRELIYIAAVAWIPSR